MNVGAHLCGSTTSSSSSSSTSYLNSFYEANFHVVIYLYCLLVFIFLIMKDLNPAQDFLKHKRVSLMTSSPLSIPWLHRTPHGSSMILSSVLFPPTAQAGPPRYSWQQPVGKSRVMPVQGEALRILKYENLCPMRTEEYLYHLEKQVPGCGALAGQC